MDILHWNMYCTEICVVLQTKSSMTRDWQGTDGMWYCSDNNIHVFCSPYMCTVLREMSMLILVTVVQLLLEVRRSPCPTTSCSATLLVHCGVWAVSVYCRIVVFYFVAVVHFVGGGYRTSSKHRSRSASLKEANGKQIAEGNNEQKQLKCVNEYKET